MGTKGFFWYSPSHTQRVVGPAHVSNPRDSCEDLPEGLQWAWTMLCFLFWGGRPNFADIPTVYIGYVHYTKDLITIWPLITATLASGPDMF